MHRVKASSPAETNQLTEAYRYQARSTPNCQLFISERWWCIHWYCVTPPVSHPTPSEINIAITQLQFTTRLGFLRVLDGSQWKAGLGRERGCFLRNIGEAFRLKPAEEDCGKSGWGSSCETWKRSVWGVGGEFRMKHGRVGSCEAFREASCEARRGGL